MEILAEVEIGEIGEVVANDGARSSFTVRVGDSLLALDANLTMAGQWPVGPADCGWHATAPGRGLALISGNDEVRLLDRQGRVRWRCPNPPWSSIGSGCAWFDQAGEPHAVVLAPDRQGCLVLCLDLDSGRPVAQAPIEAWPYGGINPVHHPNGWVGLSDGEGQNTSCAWWARSQRQPAGQARIQIIAAGWDDEILCDADSYGTMIVTMRYPDGPVLVRSFPDLRIRRTIEVPPYGICWEPPACFAGDLILANLSGPGYGLVAIDGDGAVHTLDDHGGGWLLSAAHDTWLTATRTRIRHGKIAGWPSGPPPQTIPFF